MTVNDPPDRESGSPASDRLPYEKPAVSWEERMDVRPGLMAACQKVGGSGDPSCESVSSS